MDRWYLASADNFCIHESRSHEEIKQDIESAEKKLNENDCNMIENVILLKSLFVS